MGNCCSRTPKPEEVLTDAHGFIGTTDRPSKEEDAPVSSVRAVTPLPELVTVNLQDDEITPVENVEYIPDAPVKVQV